MSRIICALLMLLITSDVRSGLLVEQPARAHGYFIGDVLLQRINLDSSDKPVTAKFDTELRINSYLYRMASKEVIVKEQTWLELRYQIINSPSEAKAIALPSVSFETASGTQETIPAWEFTVTPLTAAGLQSELSPLPNRRAVDVIDRHNGDKLKLYLAVLIATLALWLTWWVVRHFKDKHTLPFARAHRRIKRLPAADRDSDSSSWITLLHAFNSVAGKTISKSTVSQLFEAAPWLVEYRTSVESFYAASSARFYQQSETQFFAVSKLCATLQRAEKRQARQQKKLSSGSVA